MLKANSYQPKNFKGRSTRGWSTKEKNQNNIQSVVIINDENNSNLKNVDNNKPQWIDTPKKIEDSKNEITNLLLLSEGNNLFGTTFSDHIFNSKNEVCNNKIYEPSYDIIKQTHKTHDFFCQKSNGVFKTFILLGTSFEKSLSIELFIAEFYLNYFQKSAFHSCVIETNTIEEDMDFLESYTENDTIECWQEENKETSQSQWLNRSNSFEKKTEEKAIGTEYNSSLSIKFFEISPDFLSNLLEKNLGQWKGFIGATDFIEKNTPTFLINKNLFQIEMIITSFIKEEFVKGDLMKEIVSINKQIKEKLREIDFFSKENFSNFFSSDFTEQDKIKWNEIKRLFDWIYNTEYGEIKKLHNYLFSSTSCDQLFKLFTINEIPLEGELLFKSFLLKLYIISFQKLITNDKENALVEIEFNLKNKAIQKLVKESDDSSLIKEFKQKFTSTKEQLYYFREKDKELNDKIKVLNISNIKNNINIQISDVFLDSENYFDINNSLYSVNFYDYFTSFLYDYNILTHTTNTFSDFLEWVVPFFIDVGNEINDNYSNYNYKKIQEVIQLISTLRFNLVTLKQQFTDDYIDDVIFNLKNEILRNQKQNKKKINEFCKQFFLDKTTEEKKRTKIINDSSPLFIKNSWIEDENIGLSGKELDNEATVFSPKLKKNIGCNLNPVSQKEEKTTEKKQLMQISNELDSVKKELEKSGKLIKEKDQQLQELQFKIESSQKERKVFFSPYKLKEDFLLSWESGFFSVSGFFLFWILLITAIITSLKSWIWWIVKKLKNLFKKTRE